ncbi:hypothetical protein AMR42_02525 [Limnothrix sp. PR1529]|nr:hypothetical protein BCR12_18560 [Limnothrix sp. P13C2]PIB15169.1 hypothetical protein AMR42_02525 [Limnothrix sp. PR1529]
MAVVNWIDRTDPPTDLEASFFPDGYSLMQSMSLVNVLSLENSAQHSTEFCPADLPRRILYGRILRRFSESVFLKNF